MRGSLNCCWQELHPNSVGLEHAHYLLTWLIYHLLYLSKKSISIFFYFQVFRPVSASARLYINPYAEAELKTPKIDCNVEVQRIVIEFTKPQASWFGIYHPFQFVMNYSVFSLEKNSSYGFVCLYACRISKLCNSICRKSVGSFPCCVTVTSWWFLHSDTFLWTLWEPPHLYSALPAAFFTPRECNHE